MKCNDCGSEMVKVNDMLIFYTCPNCRYWFIGGDEGEEAICI